MTSDTLNQRFLFVPKYAVVLSLFIHIALPFGWVVVKTLEQLGIIVMPKHKDLIEEKYENYIQVDVIALPDQLNWEKIDASPDLPIVDNIAKTAAEPPPVVQEKVAAVNPAEELLKRAAVEEALRKEAAAKKKIEEEKKKQEDEKAKAEKEKALKKLKADQEKEAALKALKEKEGKQGRQKLAGNKVSKGTGTTGLIGTSKEAYGALVKRRVGEHFRILPGQDKKGLVAIVYIALLPTGRLKEKRIVKSSRDSIFDSAVLQAIEEAQPLPVPEDPAMLADGIKLEFRPEAK